MPGATGAEIQKRLKAQAVEMGAQVQRGNVVKAAGEVGAFFLTGAKGETWRGRTLLLATGVARCRPTVDGDFTPCFAHEQYVVFFFFFFFFVFYWFRRIVRRRVRGVRAASGTSSSDRSLDRNWP